MNLAEAFRSTTFRWSLAIALALLVQSAILAGTFYVFTAQHATGAVDKVLLEDCRALRSLSRSALVDKIRAKIESDAHRVNLAGCSMRPASRSSGI